MEKPEKKPEKIQKVVPVNTKAKDTFFKKLYEKEKRQRELTSFLLGLNLEKVSISNLRPIIFGNKENDFACICDDIFFVLAEEQSSMSPNIPYRLVEYTIAGLRSMAETERLLYSRTRVQFPIPKLYVLQVGLETKQDHSPEKVQYDMHLSDAYVSAREKYGNDAPKPDLEATVHVYDFRMALNEVLNYIERENLPERFEAYDNDMRSYALIANGLTYMQRIGRYTRYIQPNNVSNVAEYLELLLHRGIFVDLLSDKEVCDMTLAQFSREEALRYQGWEEGIEEERQRTEAERRKTEAERRKTEAERRKTEAERRKTEAERRKTEAERILGIRNMVETYLNFNQPKEAAKAAVAKKYPNMSDEFITSIISEIYGG